MINLIDYYQQKENWLAEEMDGELLLFDTKNLKTVLLNSSSKIVWELLDTDLTVQEIVAKLEDDFPDHAHHIEHDVLNTISQLLDLELVTKYG
ncbi:MAG: PqqD family protein [Gammaproteobacteria bacterium]|nr:PqqD family protein [Gammaproteobacteria bacterium]